MMTYEEMQRSLDSVANLRNVTSAKWLDGTWHKLHAFITWFDPPATKKSPESLNVKAIAKDYGMRMFNQLLYSFKIQYPSGNFSG